MGEPEALRGEGESGEREQELRAAGAALGVTDVRFLGYRDSGMGGTPENKDPRAT